MQIHIVFFRSRKLKSYHGNRDIQMREVTTHSKNFPVYFAFPVSRVSQCHVMRHVVTGYHVVIYHMTGRCVVCQRAAKYHLTVHHVTLSYTTTLILTVDLSDARSLTDMFHVVVHPIIGYHLIPHLTIGYYVTGHHTT